MIMVIQFVQIVSVDCKTEVEEVATWKYHTKLNINSGTSTTEAVKELNSTLDDIIRQVDNSKAFIDFKDLLDEVYDEIINDPCMLNHYLKEFYIICDDAYVWVE